MWPRATASILALILALCAGCAHQTYPLSEPQAASVREGVRATLDAFRRYAAEGKWDLLGGLYVDDANFRWVESGAVRYRSVAEVRKALSSLSTGSRIETTYKDVEIIPLSPDVAMVTLLFETRLVSITGGGFSFGGAMTMVLVRRDDAWRIAGGHTSSPARRSP